MNKLLLIFLIVVGSAYSVIAVAAHYQFRTFGWDLGYFDQIIWLLSRGFYPFSTLNKVNFLANHFSPVLIFFALLYRIHSSPVTLLISQAFLVVFSSYPLFLLVWEKTGSRLLGMAVVISFLFFIGTQWSILNEFHEATLTPLFLSLFFFSAGIKKRKLIFLFSIIGLLVTKEEFALLTAALAFTLYFYYGLKKQAVILFLFSLFFFFFLTQFFMPAISEKGVYQHAHLSPEAPSPWELTLKILTDPVYILKSFLSPPVKIQTLLISFSSFAYLPLFAPFSVLVPVIEQFLMRFLYTGPQFTVFTNVNHHAAPIAVLLPVSVVFAVVRLMSRFPRKKRFILLSSSLLILVASVFQDIIQKAPFHSIVKPALYQESEWQKNAGNALKQVPLNSSVAAQNSLFPHLSQRKEIYLLPETGNADFLAVDLSDGPNKFSPLNLQKTRVLIYELEEKNIYRVYFRKGDAIIYRKVN